MQDTNDTPQSTGQEGTEAPAKEEKCWRGYNAEIEHACWYIDWTTWTMPLPDYVTMVNVFVGTLEYVDGKATIGGFGNMSLSALDTFVAACHKQNMAVKVSIGGGGGQYDRCWDLLTDETAVSDFASGMDEFCRSHDLDGIDFDYEEYLSQQQELLVGKLIAAFKALNPQCQTSLCTNAGFGTNYPWKAVVQTIMDAAFSNSTGKCALDRLYVMSYYDPMTQELGWLKGWRDWVQQRYGLEAWQVSAGIDDFDAHAYDIGTFSRAVAQLGLSTGYWAWDPAYPAKSNQSTQEIMGSYKDACNRESSSCSSGSSHNAEGGDHPHASEGGEDDTFSHLFRAFDDHMKDVDERLAAELTDFFEVVGDTAKTMASSVANLYKKMSQ